MNKIILLFSSFFLLFSNVLVNDFEDNFEFDESFEYKDFVIGNDFSAYPALYIKYKNKIYMLRSNRKKYIDPDGYVSFGDRSFFNFFLEDKNLKFSVGLGGFGSAVKYFCVYNLEELSLILKNSSIFDNLADSRGFLAEEEYDVNIESNIEKINNNKLFLCSLDLEKNSRKWFTKIESVKISDDNKIAFTTNNDVYQSDFSGKNLKKIAVIRDGEEIEIFREFSDLSEDDEMFAIVQQAVTAGWISGYDDGTIGLEKEINRAEFAKILIKAFGFDTADKANLARFSDVIETEWYYDTLAQAVSLGLMKGYPDSTIKPAQTINSVEAMKMVSEIFSEKKNLDEKFAPARRGEMISETEQWFTPCEIFLTENLAKICVSGFCGAEAVFSNKKYEDKMTRGNAILLISLLLAVK